MDNNERRLIYSLFENILSFVETQSNFAQGVIQEFEQLSVVSDLRRKVAEMPDGDERTALKKRLDRLDFEWDASVRFAELKAALEKQTGSAAAVRAKLTEMIKNLEQ